MSFKNQKLFHSTPNVDVSIPRYEFIEGSEKSECRVVFSDDTENRVPSPSDYTLENLLAAGVPLQPVDSKVISSVPDDVEPVIRKIISENPDSDTFKQNPSATE